MAEHGPDRETTRDLVAHVLGYEPHLLRDDLRDLPGFSLASLQVLAAIRHRFGVCIPVERFMRDPTISGLTAAIRDGAGAIVRTTRPDSPGEVSGSWPMSGPQRCFVRIAMPTGNTSAANNIAVFRLPWRDEFELRRATLQVAREHRALCSRFTGSGLEDGSRHEPVSAESLPLSIYDGNAFDQAAVAEHAAEMAASTMSLERDAPWELRVLHASGATEATAILKAHNLAADGYSLALLQEELFDTLRCRPPERAESSTPSRVDYVTIAQWADAERMSPRFDDDREYWERTVPTSGLYDTRFDAGPAGSRAGPGAATIKTLPRPLIEALQRLSVDCGLSTFTCLLAAYGVLIARTLGFGRSIIGVPMHGRHHPESLDLVGCFALPVPVPISAEGNFVEICTRVDEVTSGLREHWRYQFDDLLEYEPASPHEPFPAIKCIFNQEWFASNEVHGRPRDEHRSIGRELGFHLQGLAGRAHGEWYVDWIYRTDLFDASYVDRLAALYLSTLEELLAEPGRALVTPLRA